MRRGRRKETGAFPYWRSILIMSSLVAGLMLFWGAIEDPRTGEFADPQLAGLALLAVIAILPIVFYVDYRTQSKHRTVRGQRARHGAAAGESRFRTAGVDVAGH
jgi:hypothetical protein